MVIKKTSHSVQLAAMDRILRKAGAKRVSDNAKKALRQVIEEFADKIAIKSVMFAKHANRTTIKEKDVSLAKKELR